MYLFAYQNENEHKTGQNPFKFNPWDYANAAEFKMDCIEFWQNDSLAFESLRFDKEFSNDDCYGIDLFLDTQINKLNGKYFSFLQFVNDSDYHEIARSIELFANYPETPSYTGLIQLTLKEIARLFVDANNKFFVESSVVNQGDETFIREFIEEYLSQYHANLNPVIESSIDKEELYNLVFAESFQCYRGFIYRK